MDDFEICTNCECPIMPGELIFNVEGEDLCESCAWEQLMRIPKSEILKEFYNVRPTRRTNGTDK